jgi:hypothetical protein
MQEPYLGQRVRSREIDMPDTSSIEVFVSYAHRDEELKNELLKHLSGLRRRKVIAGWHDGEIGAGEEWERQISEHLNKADIILLLISSDFLASDFCYDIELKRAMERHEAGEARVIPIILRDVDWTGAPFSKLKALPKDGKPVTSKYWSSADEAFRNATEGIRKEVEKLLEIQISYLFDKLDVAESSRNWPVAISLGERILALLPEDEEARARTAAAYINKCARYVQKNHKQTDPYGRSHPSLPYNISSSFATNAELERDVNHAVELDPNSAEGYYWLSALQYGENRVESLTRAIERDRNNGKYYYRRSQARESIHLWGIKFDDIGGTQKLRDQAFQRGCQRVNEAAQQDFDRAIALGYEEAVIEKNYKKLDPTSLSSRNPDLEALLDLLNEKK